MATSLRTKFTRRSLFTGAAVIVCGGGAVFAANWFNITARAGQDGTLSVQDAHKAAQAGTITLIDIRRPDEWARTGIGVGAIPINMLDRDFTDQLTQQVGGDTTVPIALICARGVRSRKLSGRLRSAGFTQILDVPEGMLGSGAGPGWIKSGLPVVKG